MIERLTTEGTAMARSDGSRHTIFPVATGPEEGESLRGWVLRESASQTIEVGLGYGISTLYTCEALSMSTEPAPRHLAIDPHQANRFSNCGLQFLDEAGVRHMVDHHSRESQIVLPRLVESGRRFDLAFIDGNHRFDGVFLDLVYLGRLVRPGGIIFADDFQLPSVAKAVSFFVNNLDWTIEEVSAADERHNWAVLRTGRQADRRLFDHFVDF